MHVRVMYVFMQMFMSTCLPMRCLRGCIEGEEEEGDKGEHRHHWRRKEAGRSPTWQGLCGCVCVGVCVNR